MRMSGWHPGRPLPCCQGRHLGCAGCRSRAHELDREPRGQKHEAPAFARAPRSTSSVSRVLFRAEVTRDAAAYHSSRTTVTGRLEQPTRGLGRAVRHRLLGSRDPRRRHARLCGLAPDGVCLAVTVTGDAVGSYPAVSPLPGGHRERSQPGGLFSVALSLAFPPPGVTRHRALRSSDFPPVTVPLACESDPRPAIACTASTGEAWARRALGARATTIARRSRRRAVRSPYVRARHVCGVGLSLRGRTNARADTKGTTTSP